MESAFEKLLAEYGRRKGVDLAVENGSAEVSVDDVPILFADLPESGEMSVMGRIGPAPAEGAEELMTTLMIANFAQQGSARGALARHPETGDFWLCRTLSLEHLDAERMDAAMTGFIDVLLAWCDVLRNYRPAARAGDGRDSKWTFV